ncbi:MAG: hypothetical protein ACREOU_13850, partial [Candidatus Eiseniibacteriota bacterium]
LAGRVSGVRDARVIEDCMLVVQVEGEGSARGAIETLLADPVFAGLKIVAAVSADVPLDDPTLLLWGVFTRFDAARDVFFSETSLRGAWPVSRGRMGIDSTWKTGYPDPVAMPEDVIRRVDARWAEIWR